MLEELVYFNEGESLNALLKNEEILKKPSMALQIKRSSDALPSNAIDEIITQMVYGNARKPPGDENCPFQKLLVKKEDDDLIGIWVPWNTLAKGMALKWLFPSVSGPYRFPDEKPVPQHIAIAYDAFKYRDVVELMDKFPGQVLKFGFFTSDNVLEAALIAKTVDKFENKTVPTTYEEKMVLQLSKSSLACLEAFHELGPSYASVNAVEGEQECKIFFPPDYDIPEEVIDEIKKKPKRKLRQKAAAPPPVSNEETTTPPVAQEAEPTDTPHTEDDPDEPECAVADEDEEVEEDDEGEDIGEADKATSPMGDEQDDA